MDFGPDLVPGAMPTSRCFEGPIEELRQPEGEVGASIDVGWAVPPVAGRRLGIAGSVGIGLAMCINCEESWLRTNLGQQAYGRSTFPTLLINLNLLAVTMDLGRMVDSAGDQPE